MKNLIIKGDRQFDISFIKELGLDPGTWQDLYKERNIKSSFNKKKYSMFIKEVVPDTLFFFQSFGHVREHALGAGIVLLNRAMGMFGIAFLLFFVPLVIFAFSLDRQRFRLKNMAKELAREKRLKEENASRYQSVIENNSRGFWTVNPDTAVIESVNQTLCDMLGLSPVELINKLPTDLVVENDIPKIIAKSTEGEEHYTLTATMVGSGNKRIPVHIESRLMRDVDGKPMFRYCFISDLSQEMESLEKIRLLEAVVEQAPSSIVVTDIDGRIQYVNPAFSKVTGYTYEEAVGNNPRILKSAQHDASIYEDLWQVLNSGKVWRGRLCNKTKTDSLYWEEAVIAPVRNDEGIVSNYVAIKNDITEKVLLEEKLQQKLTEKELIVQYAGVGILYVRGEQIVEFNEMAVSMLAVSQDKFVLKEISDIFPSEDEYQVFVEDYFPDLRAGKTVEFEQERAGKSGDKIHLRGTARAVDHDFNDHGSVWIIQDITAIHNEKKRLERERQEAEDTSTAKSMFLANMSHEIRTPMNAIIGMTRLVRETELDSEQQRYMDRIAVSSAILLDIINDILDYSKIEAGQLLLDKRPFLTEQLVDTLYSMMKDLAEKKGLGFEIICDADVPDALIGDMSRLVQVLVNLVGNGIKFTQQGEVKVRVSSLGQEPNLERVTLSFSVEDSGIGIAPDKISNIFQKFQQADSSVSRRFGGTGLGLAISKKIVRLMGGDISVTSRVGVGSTFSFLIELDTCSVDTVLANAKEGEKRTAAEQDATSRNKLKVLLVEDNEINCELATIVLEKFGHSVYPAENGMDALTMLARENFDIVIMDVQMPEMDGVTATKVIRAAETEKKLPVNLPEELSLRLKNRLAGRHIPIIAMTAHVMESDRQRCVAAGMDDYLTKPLQPEQVQASLLGFAGVANGKSMTEEKRETEKNLIEADGSVVFRVKEHLADVYGVNDVQIEQLLTSAERSISSNLEKAQTCLARGELKMLSSVGHALKGNLLNLGLTVPASVAADIEVSARAGEQQPYQQWLDYIRDELGDLLEIDRADLSERG